MTPSDNIAFIALLLSALSIYVSYRGYLVAKKAQTSSEEWRKIDKSRKQFIAQVIDARHRSTEFWEDELMARIRASSKSHRGTVTAEEITNAELPPVDNLPNFDFEFLWLELSLANLHHIEKRLNKIEIHIEFTKARWFNKRIQLSEQCA